MSDYVGMNEAELAVAVSDILTECCDDGVSRNEMLKARDMAAMLAVKLQFASKKVDYDGS